MSSDHNLGPGFGNVDAAHAPQSFVRYLDGFSAIQMAQAYKGRVSQLLQVGEGDAVLDVGCGTGDDARALALLVGSHGRVLGIDTSEAMIATARERTASA